MSKEEKKTMNDLIREAYNKTVYNEDFNDKDKKTDFNSILRRSLQHKHDGLKNLIDRSNKKND